MNGPEDNLQRMIHLAEEFFETKNDPTQISVTAAVLERLRAMHPATVMEEANEHGPIAWVLLIPTTHELMQKFIGGELNEQELLERTPPGVAYDSLYLCSALVLPEERNRGLATRLATGGIRSMLKDHPIRSLFYWAFSTEGGRLAASIAREVGLPLYRRECD